MTQGEYELRWDLLLDGSHPTIEGYEAMAEQFDPAALGLAAKNPEPELG